MQQNRVSLLMIKIEEGYDVDVVNAYHVKKVPGRKTDVADSQWLAHLCVSGLLNPSFIPPQTIRSLRLLTRYRTKTIRQISSEKNRMLKVLEFSGIRLSYAMSRADCVSGMAMIRAIASRCRETKIRHESYKCSLFHLNLKKS